MRPDWTWDWVSFVQEVRALVSLASCSCGEGGFNAPIGNFNSSLRKYRTPAGHHCRFCDSMGQGLLEEGLHLMCRLGGRSVGASIVTWYNHLRTIASHLCIHDLKKLLKEVTGLLKMGGYYIHPHWRHLTYWETCYGYVEYKESGSMREEVLDWLVNNRTLGGSLGEATYLTELYRETISLLEEEWRVPDKLPTAREWVYEGVWMRGKAGTGGQTTIEIEGKVKRSRRYKGVDAALYDDELILTELFKPTREEMIVMQKSEGGKVRPVVKTGNPVYRKMDYLSELVESGFKGSRTSTLFAGPAGNEEIDELWLREVEDFSRLKVPLDQSSFDQRQSRNTILTVLAAIGDYCLQFTNPEKDDYQQVWAALWETLAVRQPRVIYEKDTFIWGNGVPSGWRWTALIDTILNISSFRVAKRIVEATWKTNLPVFNICAQGDDIIFSTRGVKNVERLVYVYGHLGYLVHPQKTYISRSRAEFLRRSYEPGILTGYSTRTQLTLRFRNPIVPLPISPVERLGSRATLWMLAEQRGAKPRAVAELYLEDAEQMGVESSRAADFALTPSTYGGLGMRGDVPGTVGGWLQRHRSYPEVWVSPTIEKPSLRIRPNLGMWARRLRRVGFTPTGSTKEKFNLLLSQTWGFREADLVGEVTTGWEERKPVLPREPSTGYGLPDPSSLWNMGGIPAILIPLIKIQSLDDDTYERFIKQEFIEQVRLIRRGMSNTTFKIYMGGMWKIPIPLVDGVGARYGRSIKAEARKWMLRFFAVRNLSLDSLLRNILWLEEKVRGEFRQLAKFHILGV